MGVLCDALVTGRVMEVSCKALQYPYHADESAEGTDIMILITGQVIMTPEHRERMIALGAEHSARSRGEARSEEHTSELQSLMRISYAVFCLKKKKHIYQLMITSRSMIRYK